MDEWRPWMTDPSTGVIKTEQQNKPVMEMCLCKAAYTLQAIHSNVTARDYRKWMIFGNFKQLWAK